MAKPTPKPTTAEDVVEIKAKVPRSLARAVDGYAEQLSKERKGPMTRAQAIRELLVLALDAANGAKAVEDAK